MKPDLEKYLERLVKEADRALEGLENPPTDGRGQASPHWLCELTKTICSVLREMREGKVRHCHVDHRKVLAPGETCSCGFAFPVEAK